MSRSTPTDVLAALDQLLGHPSSVTPPVGDDDGFVPPDESFDWFDPDPDGFEADAAADRYYS